jgi:hypothetical protein
MNIQHLRNALAGEPKAEEAIFWFAYAWQSGKGSELYDVLKASEYQPPTNRQFADDPDVIRLFEVLEERFGPFIQPLWLPVRWQDVEEGDVLVAGGKYLCIPDKWPCKVYRDGAGSLCVLCRDGFHRLTPDAEGMIIGFRR